MARKISRKQIEAFIARMRAREQRKAEWLPKASTVERLLAKERAMARDFLSKEIPPNRLQAIVNQFVKRFLTSREKLLAGETGELRNMINYVATIEAFKEMFPEKFEGLRKRFKQPPNVLDDAKQLLFKNTRKD